MKHSVTESGKKKYYFAPIERVTKVVVMPGNHKSHSRGVMQTKHGLPLIFKIGATPKSVAFLDKAVYNERLSKARGDADAAINKLERKAKKEFISFYLLEKIVKSSRKITLLN